MERLSRPALAAALDLEPHPEGGWFRRTWTSPVTVPSAGGEARPTATAIYYVLGPGEQSVWHQVSSAELWLHHAGVPLRLRIGGTGETPGGDVTEVLLGSDLAGGQQPQALVPASAWQAAEPAADGEVLVSCLVSPGFDFADWRTLPD